MGKRTYKMFVGVSETYIKSEGGGEVKWENNKKNKKIFGLDKYVFQEYKCMYTSTHNESMWPYGLWDLWILEIQY